MNFQKNLSGWILWSKKDQEYVVWSQGISCIEEPWCYTTKDVFSAYIWTNVEVLPNEIIERAKDTENYSWIRLEKTVSINTQKECDIMINGKKIERLDYPF